MGETIFTILHIIWNLIGAIMFIYFLASSYKSTDKHSQIMCMLYAILIAVLIN